MFDGNSIAKATLKYIEVNRKDSKEDMAFITRLSLSTNKMSIGNFIKKVCIELHGLKIRA